MKKLLLLSSLLLLSIVSWSAPHGKFGKTLSWRYDKETATLYVTGTGDLPYPVWAKKNYKNSFTSKELPYTFGDPQRVKGNAKWQVKNVVLSEGITSVADNVFNNCTFDEFTMPASLENIAGSSWVTIGKLYYKGSLEQWLNLQVADKCLHGARRVGKVFVAGMDLDDRVVIPQSVTHLPAYAFNHRKISELVLPNTIKSVDEKAFQASKIGKIDFLGTADEWCITDFSPVSRYLKGELLFKGKQLPASLRLSDKVQKIPAYAFCRQTQLATVVLPSGVLSIGEKAFYGCGGMTDVALSADLQHIGDSAFYGTRLTEIDLPQPLEYIGVASFANTNISRVTWRMPNYYYNDNIFDKSNINYFTFTSSVSTIPAGLCRGMTRLWYLTVEDGVKTIGIDAFKGSAVVRLVLPKSVSSIESGAFSGCTNLKLVTIPNHYCKIRQDAFDGCKKLTRQPYAGGTVDDKRQKEQLPELWVTMIDGDAVEISGKLQDGHYTMLMFDASWCVPSRKMMKYVEENFQDWQQQYPDLQLITVYSHDSGRKQYTRFGDIYFDTKEYNISKKVFNVNSYPVIFFVDKYGKGIVRFIGYNPDKVPDALQKLYQSK